MSIPRSVVATTAGAAAVAALLLAPATADATPSTTVVVEEVYGGGGNSGATYTNDFIELYNRGSALIDLSSYSVQYISAAPSSSTTWQVTPLTGTIAAGGSYLIGEAQGSAGTTALPTPNDSGTINMSATAGTVALATTQTALTCKTASACASTSTIKDLVGYGNAVIDEGTDAPTTSNTTSDSRAATGADTDHNAADFTAGSPSPKAGPRPLRIHDIQGASWVSPQNGNAVTNVPGIVTALRTAGASKGYWIQDPSPDSNSATSEGLFVYTSSAPTVAVGDSVLVSGTVKDYYVLGTGDTTSNTSNLSVTELTSPTATILSHSHALPAPIVLGASTVPSTYAPNLNNANIESTPITPTRSALDYYESIEGMRVEVDNAHVVGPSDQYGEQFITTKPTQLTTYRGGTYLPGENQTPSGRLEVVADDGTNPGVSVKDIFTGATVGNIDWSQYGGYVLDASTLGSVTAGNLAPIVATAQTSTQLSIATYNVENLAPTDPQTKFDRLAAGVVTNLAKPDIIAVEEVQDNSGATDDGTVSATTTISKLTSAISAAGGPTYSYREIDPANDKDGGQPGGNIRVVYLYNPARVTFVDRGASSVNRTTTGTSVVTTSGQPDLTLSPGRIDPGNSVWSSSRKPLVGEFSFNGKPVFVIANHFDAKLGDQNADGRFQYPNQSSATQRAGQAQVVHDFVSSILKVNSAADVVVLGDLNDYQFSPALAALKTGTSDGSGTSILTDLITTLPANKQYTYVYNGVSQVLDHILLTSGVSSYTYQVVHVNSEYANQVSDHDPQVVQLKP